MRLFIDDERTHSDAVVVRTPAEAIAVFRVSEHFETEFLEEVWFDHDLGLEADIWDVVRFLERRIAEGRPIFIEQCVVHSMNPVGAERLMVALEHAGYDVVRVGTETLANVLTYP